MSSHNVPAWTKRHPLLRKKANRLDWQAWLIAADMAEEAGNMEEADKLRHNGELFRAICQSVQEAQNTQPRCYKDYHVLSDKTKVRAMTTQSQVRLQLLFHGLWSRYANYHFGKQYLQNHEYLPTRIVNEILAWVL